MTWKRLSLVTYVLLPAGFKSDRCFVLAVKLNSAKVISFTCHQIPEVDYLRISKKCRIERLFKKGFFGESCCFSRTAHWEILSGNRKRAALTLFQGATVYFIMSREISEVQNRYFSVFGFWLGFMLSRFSRKLNAWGQVFHRYSRKNRGHFCAPTSRLRHILSITGKDDISSLTIPDAKHA